MNVPFGIMKHLMIVLAIIYTSSIGIVRIKPYNLLTTISSFIANFGKLPIHLTKEGFFKERGMLVLIDMCTSIGGS